MKSLSIELTFLPYGKPHEAAVIDACRAAARRLANHGTIALSQDHYYIDMGKIMAGSSKLTIELKYDVDSKDQEEALIQAARMTAKHLFTTAVLVSNNRQPEIAMHSDSFFEGREKIELADDFE